MCCVSRNGQFLISCVAFLLWNDDWEAGLLLLVWFFRLFINDLYDLCFFLCLTASSLLVHSLWVMACIPLEARDV